MIERFIEEHMPEYVDLIINMTRIPAPSYKEERRAEFVLDFLREIGLGQSFIDDAGNVICEIKGGNGGKLHMFAAHLDTVFADEDEIMTEIRDGKICGPGVGDDTANVCALLMCLKYIREKNIIPCRDMVFAFNTCEEGLGNLKGSRALMKRYGDRLGQFVSFDLGYDGIINRAVGSRRFKLEIRTKGGHSFSDFGNTNAIAVAADLIHELYKIDAGKMPGKTTYNAGIIDGGTSVNTIAQHVTFMYEYRSDQMGGLDQMHEKMMEVIEKYQKREDIAFEMRLIGDRPSMGQVNEKEMKELTLRVSDTLERYTGRKPVISSGSTDCNIPLSEGITSICFGTCLDIGPHTREEYVPIESLKPGLLAAIHFVVEDMDCANC